jgi:putative acetyltransferase
MKTMVDIGIADLSRPDLVALISDHLGDMAGISPPESNHTLDIDALKNPNITVWTARRQGQLMGCGALKELTPGHGEIKSMRTHKAHLRQGVAARLLEHIINTARQRSYRRLSLETGTQDEFAAAQALYRRNGFEYCDPFADYILDPLSCFMTLKP